MRAPEQASVALASPAPGLYDMNAAFMSHQHAASMMP
jgi:hypothetical protein